MKTDTEIPSGIAERLLNRLLAPWNRPIDRPRFGQLSGRVAEI